MMNKRKCLNLIVCGTGGQGNVLLSRFLARAFIKKGYFATIGETFGMSQRGGDVMSHIRVSKNRPYGPLIPEGQADVILSLEPMETIRVIRDYGNPSMVVISNVRMIYPPIAITGEKDYPAIEEIKRIVREMAARYWYLDATQISLEMGNTILTNMVMMGALVGANVVDLTTADLEETIRDTFSDDQAQTNITAIAKGMEAVQNK